MANLSLGPQQDLGERPGPFHVVSACSAQQEGWSFPPIGLDWISGPGDNW